MQWKPGRHPSNTNLSLIRCLLGRYSHLPVLLLLFYGYGCRQPGSSSAEPGAGAAAGARAGAAAGAGAGAPAAALAGASRGAGQQENPYPTIGQIPPPDGYHRPAEPATSFASWLRAVPLKSDKTVYLFDGTPKRNQSAQFAVLNIPVGHTDLQQCADAVMRLRAEYLYSIHRMAAIDFYTDQHVRLNFSEWEAGRRVRLEGGQLHVYTVAASLPGTGGSARSDHGCTDRPCFDAYLQTVFAYCGTHSLEQQLEPVRQFGDIGAGDVLIRGGFPGHAMLVADMAVNSQGRKVYLLAQSYMPAQDIHIVRNPDDPALSPWFAVPPAASNPGSLINTPEWVFHTGQLRRWP